MNHEIKQCCHFLVNKCKIFKMLIDTLFLRLFEPDQSEIKEIFQEIVNIHNGSDFLRMEHYERERIVDESLENGKILSDKWGVKF